METLSVSNYREYKEALDNQLKEAAEGFVRIGYLLKLARDTDILAGSGYANVNEFAKEEYNMDKSMVSRFININTKFAENGCSEFLKEQYRGFGYAKLALMLQLPETVNEELTPDFTKSEIQAIKEEIDAERSVTDIEVLLEGEKEEQKAFDRELDKVLHQLGEDEPELFVQLYDCFHPAAGLEAVQEVLAPSGTQIYSVRIRGVGRLMLSLQSDSKEVALINIRSGDKELYTWEALYEALEQLMIVEGAGDGKTAWQIMYQREFPKKPKVAPVQPEKKPKKETKVSKAKIPSKEKKDVTRKEDRETNELVQKTDTPESQDNSAEYADRTVDSTEASGGETDRTSEQSPAGAEDIPVEIIPESEISVDEQDEQLPGQMNVEDYPELMPEKIPNAEPVKTVSFETADRQQDPSDSACEIDMTFKERIQTAEWILEAVRRDNKSDARMYCHELLRLLGEFE